MELISVGTSTYYIKNNTNIGLYKINDTDVFLIDSGNDKEAGRKIAQILTANNWRLVGIINTHAHADHTGGNKFLQDRNNALIYSLGIDKSIIANPLLEPALLYGANPLPELKTKFLMAKPSIPNGDITSLPSGLSYINLKGHYFDMVGVKTSDNIYFLGDALVSIDTINKYHIFYLYDVKEYLNTLDYLETLDGSLYIASHVEATSNLKEIIAVNRAKIMEIIDLILNVTIEPVTFEDILMSLFNHYNLTLNLEQYYLVGSTIKAYLTYLYEEHKIIYTFIDNKMFWKNI